ncbi:hypothetical protein ZIOFF_031748 [Zingiber officinale]|uniref:Uncharacterized protein n=1 Tax=Zingiber officinale TaxID=94328 RepID=A0A8J5GLV0_ZINOF|nr:hypothetical protein ZIOFF_031748 [Zingiber officinale]
MNWLLDGFITSGEGAKCCASEVLLAIAALAMLSLPQCTGFLEMNWLLDGFITAGEGAKCCASEVLLAIAALAVLFVDDPWLRPTFRSKVIL